jgi:hypothetical protein
LICDCFLICDPVIGDWDDSGFRLRQGSHLRAARYGGQAVRLRQGYGGQGNQSQIRKSAITKQSQIKDHKSQIDRAVHEAGSSDQGCHDP